MGLNKKELNVLSELKKEKTELLKNIFEQGYFPKDIYTIIDKVNKDIDTKMEEIINSDTVDYHIISKFINTLIRYKVYFNRTVTSTNYFKGKLNTVKSQTKLNTIKESYDDGMIKRADTDTITIKMDSFTGYYNLIQDIIINIKNTKDLIDTTIISLQSQLKNVTFEYLNSDKINS